MSSQVCKALAIINNTLVPCTQNTKDHFCEQHSHKYRFEKPHECPICFDEISNETETPLECGHWIHRTCIQPTNLHKCSLCNQKMNQEEINYIFGIGHMEQNNYNDGTSIFWHSSQDIDDTYEDSDSDSDEEGEGLSNETPAEEILFTRNFENTTHGDIVDVLYDLEPEMHTITNSLIMDQLESQFVFRESLLTTVPTIDTSTFRDFARQIVIEKIDEISIGHRTNLPVDFAIQTFNELMSGPSINMFIILFNFMRLEHENFMVYPINVVKTNVNYMIIEMFDHLFN